LEIVMKTLFSEEQIQECVRRIAGRIRELYQGRPLTLVGVTSGSVIFLADLIRLLDMPLRVTVVQARKYAHHEMRPGPLVFNLSLLEPDVRGRNVLLVDGVLDTGERLWELIQQVDELGPASLRSAVLMRKDGRAQVPVKPDLVGFEIPNEYVVGYGLKYMDRYRNLPSVVVLEPDDMAKESPA
jgi:hypoxanthine phosphoribosyltransferase